MNIGILGTGFGTYHASLIKELYPQARIIVFGRNEAKLSKLQQELGVEVTTNADDIMLDDAVEIIDLCLPSDLHERYAVAALQNGKHVFCETPVCLSMEDAVTMLKAETQSDRRVLVNQFIKFDPAYSYLYEAVQAGTYGKLLSFSLRRETSPMWGNLGLDSITLKLMIHELDLLTALLGSGIQVTAWGTDGGKEEQALVRFLL